MICNWSLYFFCSSTRSGVSARQGPHQVAQKFRRTTFPLKAAMDKGFSSSEESLNSGAGSGLRTKRITASWSCCDLREVLKQRRNEVTTKIKMRWRRAIPMATFIGDHM